MVKYKKIWDKYPDHRTSSIIISLICWLVPGIASWFFLPSATNGGLEEVDTKAKIISIIFFAVVYLVIIAAPEIQFLFWHRQPKGGDRYSWIIPVIVFMAAGLITLLILNGIIFDKIGIIFLIHAVGLAAAIFIPRITFGV